MIFTEYKDINNTRYVINRVFGEKSTKAELIENRVLKEKNNIQALTANSGILYNSIGGSIQSEEVL